MPLSSLTVIYTRRSGFPIYSTSFAALAQTISGTVTDVSTTGACPVTGVTVRLVSPYGESLGTTTPASDGTYSFGQNATQPGYTVSIEPPPTCAAVGGVRRTVSTETSDATATFEVRRIIPQPVSGTVRADGQPLAGVPVTLHVPGGDPKTTTTAADGTYLFDDNAVRDGYFVTIAVPDGYTGTDQRAPFDIDAAPITGQNFALTANPDVSGTVTGGGSGLGGVTVTLTPATGPALTTVTAADGSYTFPRVPRRAPTTSRWSLRRLRSGTAARRCRGRDPGRTGAGLRAQPARSDRGKRHGQHRRRRTGARGPDHDRRPRGAGGGDHRRRGSVLPRRARHG